MGLCLAFVHLTKLQLQKIVASTAVTIATLMKQDQCLFH